MLFSEYATHQLRHGQPIGGRQEDREWSSRCQRVDAAASCRRALPTSQGYAAGLRQTMTVPLHMELASGTLRAIFRQACRFVPEEELRPLFFLSDSVPPPA